MKTKRRQPKPHQAPPLYLPSEDVIRERQLPKQHWHEKQNPSIREYLSKVA